MERIRIVHRRGQVPTLIAVLAVTAIVAALAPPAAHAQFGGAPETYTFRVVDQHGRPLDGSLVRIEGTTADMSTPATVDLMAGPQLVVIEPAVLGAMLPGGSLRPGGANGLSRNEFIFLNPGGGEVLIEWHTADVAVSVVDQGGSAIPGARWGFAGAGADFAPGTLTLPLTDESLHMGMTGPSVAGWRFDVRAAFDGAPIDLVRGETREATAGMTSLAFEWRQTACTMGVVDATGAAIRGATWTVLGRTFQAGDAITLPATDEALYADLAGALAAGFPTTLFTNTGFGSGDARFEVSAAGPLSPAFADVNGGAFGLRCGIAAFPPLTTGTLAVSVTADGAAYPGAQVTVVDASGAAGVYSTGTAGSFLVGDVPQGPLALTLAVPAGYHAVDPAGGSLATSITAGETRSVTFAIALDAVPPPGPVANAPESSNYWRREVAAAMRGSGRRDERPADMAVNFPQAIFAGFAQHATAPVVVEGVTQCDPDGAGATPARRLELADMDATLAPGGSEALRAAKRELLVVLLNVVSGRLSLELVVDGSGTTLEQEIRRLAAMINDGLAANDPIARGAAERINAGKAGLRMPLRPIATHDDVSDRFAAAGPDVAEAVTLTVARSAGSHRIAFTVTAPGPVTLDVYDVNGRRQARLHEGDAPAGTTERTWTASGRRGVYFARLVTALGARTAKLVASP